MTTRLKEKKKVWLHTNTTRDWGGSVYLLSIDSQRLVKAALSGAPAAGRGPLSLEACSTDFWRCCHLTGALMLCEEGTVGIIQAPGIRSIARFMASIKTTIGIGTTCNVQRCPDSHVSPHTQPPPSTHTQLIDTTLLNHITARNSLKEAFSTTPLGPNNLA